jgi:putative alpha-1,2-mannosidase
MPFGMIQVSPDTRLTGWDGCSGYHYSDQIIYGFSHTHLSGTGISDYGDILLLPSVGEVHLNAIKNGPDKGYASRFNHKDETAAPGYYAVKLEDDNIKADLPPRIAPESIATLSRYERSEHHSRSHRGRVIDSGLTITGLLSQVGADQLPGPRIK